MERDYSVECPTLPFPVYVVNEGFKDTQYPYINAWHFQQAKTRGLHSHRRYDQLTPNERIQLCQDFPTWSPDSFANYVWRYYPKALAWGFFQV